MYVCTKKQFWRKTMNNAKKLAKNNGIGTEQKKKSGENSFMFTKNKILILLGLAVIVVLCAGVCYMQLRPRAVLKVTGTNASGGETTNTVYMKEAVYNIFETESQYNMYASFYQQLYGKTYWEMEDVDSAGRNGASAAKKEVMDGLKQQEILCMEAEKLGYSLTDEEKKAAGENRKSAMENMTDGQKKLDGMDEKTLTKVFEKKALAEKYRQVIISESGIDEAALKATVDKEEYHQYTMQYYMVSNKEGTGDDAKDVSKEQKQKNYDNMVALKEKAKTAEDFTKLVEENDATGITTYQLEELVKKDMKDSSFLTEKLRKKLVKMKNEEISDVLEGEDGYYLVKMVNNNDTKAYDEQCKTVVEQEQNKQFNARYEELKASYVTEVQSYWKGRVKLGSYTTAE